jgi:hypothetical protein
LLAAAVFLSLWALKSAGRGSVPPAAPAPAAAVNSAPTATADSEERQKWQTTFDRTQPVLDDLERARQEQARETYENTVRTLQRTDQQLNGLTHQMFGGQP